MSDNFRIALVLEKFDPLRGGLESLTHQYAAWLLDQGHQVQVVTFEANTCLAVDIRLLDWSPRPRIRARRLSDCAAGLGADIIHDMGDGMTADVFHPQTSSRITSLERDLAGRAWWQRMAFALSPRCRRWRSETSEVERHQVFSARHIVVPSELARDDFLSRYDAPTVPLTVIPNGVDTRRFLSPEKPCWRESWRTRLGLSDQTLFLLVANNFHLKGLDAALQALREINREGGDAYLAVAGAGDIGKYSRRTERLGLSGRVFFLGRQERIEELFAAADVSLQPSLHDACSLSTLEGLASGLPAITTRRNGAAGFVEHGIQGFVIDGPSDIRALAGVMASLLDPDLRRRMSRETGRLRETLDSSSRFAAFTTLYRQLLPASATA